ncbi:hypothetical protein [Prochlorothrix hollandica]|uniref:Uncharacterized protein n=1 Tax=Prochlorothrix hollandica PCC 9006 = CALU 1027 TaxID=317619 RepID=A0A0M2PZF8_PROHO|nr:hypothetical protein [Prochlorothrix hollandica]KKJ00089.1 hypothetical protein PROH_10110 [Prochlorothrix hollandica PCC 9006 = CALU 1027]
MDTHKILQQLNSVKPSDNISFQLKATSSLLNVVITCSKGSNLDKQSYEKVALEAMNILMDANLVGIKTVQFYGREEGEQPCWRSVQRLPEPIVVEGFDQEDLSHEYQPDNNPFMDLSQSSSQDKSQNQEKLPIKREYRDNDLITSLPSKTNIDNSQQARKTYQFIQIRVQLLGRGMTNEIMSLYVNGKRVRPRTATFHDFLNYLGSQGFQVVTASLETEGVYTHFYTLQREILTHKPPSSDIFDDLDRIREGADFGDSVKNFFELGVDRFA